MLTATVLGSGIAFLDSTVVNVALPHIGEDLDTGVGGLQWVLNGYLLATSALILLGGLRELTALFVEDGRDVRGILEPAIKAATALFGPQSTQK